MSKAAGQLHEVELSVIPALLQTKAYAAAVERAMELPLSDSEVIERIDVRAQRQQAIDRQPDPLSVTVLVAEGALWDQVGGRDVMAEQCDHLVEMANRANVELRVLGPGRAPAAIGGFDLLTRAGELNPFMAVTFSVDGGSYIDDGHRVERFVSRFDHLWDTALSPEKSIQRIQEVRNHHR